MYNRLQLIGEGRRQRKMLEDDADFDGEKFGLYNQISIYSKMAAEYPAF